MFFFRYQKARFNPNSLWQDLGPIDWIITKFVENSWMNPVSWLVSRELTESAGYWDERLSSSGDDDGEYICRIVASSEKVKFVPEAKCYYRIGHTNSLSRRRSDKAYESIILVTKLYIEHLLSLEESKRTKAACISLLENQLIYFFPDKPELVEKLEYMSRSLGGDTLHLPFRENRKFLLFGKYFGWKNAKLVRNIWSKSLTLTKKNWERLLYTALDK
jgi:GT2 family glycosyltransferase